MSSTPAPSQSSFDIVTIDAVDAVELAGFWGRALDLSVVQHEDDGRWIVLGSTLRPRVLGLQRIVGLSRAAAHWEGNAKARVHLDLVCDVGNFVDEVKRLIDLGAARLRLDRVESYGSIATLADPEGNVFDLCAYHS